MRRFIFPLVLVVGLAAPVAAQEEVKVVDHVTKKESQVKGAIDSESPEGIKIKVGTELRLIPGVDVKYVLYKQIGNLKGYEYNGPFAKEKVALDPATKPAERTKNLADARADFEALLPRLAGTGPAERFFQFKVIELAAEQAKDDPTQLDAAVKLLQAYKTDQTKGWELVPALKLLAQMQELKGDVAEARQTYLELAKIPNLPKEMKQEADLLVAQLSLRTNKFDDAVKLLEGLRTSLGPNDPQRPNAVLYLGQAELGQGKLDNVEAHLREAIATTDKPGVKATAHNALGDYYRKKTMNEEAFWEYLRVDALYPQDRNEHAKALYYLWKLFPDVKKDKVKSQECLEKLRLLPETEYAKMAPPDK